MADVYTDLHRRGVTHLLIEPGAKLARELMDRHQADRAWVLRGQSEIGNDGMEAPACRWPIAGTLNLAGDSLSEHLNPRSEVYFAPEVSADFTLAGVR
jgi:riboflavin biosynthesis pyrimidine reductase